MQPYRNEKNQLYISFGEYTVVQKKIDYNVILKNGGFVSHEQTWKKATKIAQMLNRAYREGYSDGCSW